MNDSQFTPALFLLGFALGGLLAYLELLWLKRPLHLADHWSVLVLVALVNTGFIYLLIVAINSYYSLFIVPIPIIPMAFILIKVLIYYVLRRITRSPLHSPLALLILSLFFHGAVAIASYVAFGPINPMRSNLEAAIREKKNRWLEVMLWMSVKMEPNMTILVNEAILARNDDAVRRLINHGADPRQVYWMPQADYDTLWRITQWRLDRGVKPEAITEISQHVGIGYVAVGYGVRELAYCLQKGLEPQKYPEIIYETLMHQPLQTPNVITAEEIQVMKDKMTLLLEHGADINGPGEMQFKSILALFLIHRDLDLSPVLTLLIEKGAEINARSPHEVYPPDRGPLPRGLTPLILAVIQKRPQYIAILLKHGADKTIRDANGLTALDWANQEKAGESIMELLR